METDKRNNANADIDKMTDRNMASGDMPSADKLSIIAERTLTIQHSTDLRQTQIEQDSINRLQDELVDLKRQYRPAGQDLLVATTLDEAWDNLLNKHIDGRGDPESVIPNHAVEAWLEQNIKPDTVLVDGLPVYRGMRDSTNSAPTSSGTGDGFHQILDAVAQDIGALECCLTARQDLMRHLNREVSLESAKKGIQLDEVQTDAAKTLLFEQCALFNYKELRLIDGATSANIEQHSDQAVQDVCLGVFRSLK